MLHPRHIKAILVVPECTKKEASIPTSEQQGRASLVAAQAALAIQGTVWLPPVKFLKKHLSTFEVLNID